MNISDVDVSSRMSVDQVNELSQMVGEDIVSWLNARAWSIGDISYDNIVEFVRTPIGKRRIINLSVDEIRKYLPDMEWVVDYDEAIARKGNAFLEKQENDVEEDVLFLRTDERLDNLRDIVYPDIVYVGVIEGTEIVEYDMILSAIDGPFVKGHLIDKTASHQEYDTVMALPYEYDGGIRLFALFVGDALSHQEETVLEKIREISSRYGITFSGVSIRS